MTGQNPSLIHIFGPLVQVVFYFGLLLMTSCLIVAFSSWIGRKLIQNGNRILIAILSSGIAVGLVYGALRLSGLLMYPTDGWDTSGVWNYTNQNSGTLIIFICVCLSIGAISAWRKRAAR